MTKKEMFTEIMIEFTKLNARLDLLESKADNQVKEVVIDSIKSSPQPRYEELLKALEKDYGKQALPQVIYDQDKQSIGYRSDCMWQNLPPEDRNKPMSLHCGCKKCSPVSCSVGDDPYLVS